MLASAIQAKNQATKPTATNGSFFGSGGSTPFFQAKMIANQPNEFQDQEVGSPPIIAPVNNNRSSNPLPFLDTIQQSFGRHDVSQVQAHMDSRAAAAIGAEAFASGSDVTFSRTPTLHTAAHEAAHVIQQRTGIEVSGGIGREGDVYERHADQVADRVVGGQSSEGLLNAQPVAGGKGDSGPTRQAVGSRSPVIQMRRVPPNVRALLTTIGGGAGANYAANLEGTERLIARAMAELTPLQRATVRANRRGALTEVEFAALTRRERLSRHAEAIFTMFPTLQLGDPTLLDVLPRAGTADAANILTLVTHANTIFAAIASGAQDSSLTQVFGASSLMLAKAKYANARTRMNTLHTTNHIVTDRGSGFSEQVQEGGLTGHSQISVSPDTIDNPNARESRVTLIHESMHAGNPGDVGDNGYIHVQPDRFRGRSEADKLRNAAHFEVVPRRMLGLPHAYTGLTFIPAGTTVAGVTASLPTAAEQGARDASEQLSRAWARGLNLHRKYVQLFRTPTDWTVPQFGGAVRFDNSIPFWSKVMKMTIHLKAAIVPASADPAQHPVSQIDIALSEGLTRKIALAGNLLDPLQTEAQILAFENANSTVAERTAAFPGGVHTNANAERDFLLKLAVRHSRVAPMTGNVARDLRVVMKMGDPIFVNWLVILAPKNPADFAD